MHGTARARRMQVRPFVRGQSPRPHHCSAARPRHVHADCQRKPLQLVRADHPVGSLPCDSDCPGLGSGSGDASRGAHTQIEAKSYQCQQQIKSHTSVASRCTRGEPLWGRLIFLLSWHPSPLPCQSSTLPSVPPQHKVHASASTSAPL